MIFKEIFKSNPKKRNHEKENLIIKVIKKHGMKNIVDCLPEINNKEDTYNNFLKNLSSNKFLNINDIIQLKLSNNFNQNIESFAKSSIKKNLTIFAKKSMKKNTFNSKSEFLKSQYDESEISNVIITEKEKFFISIQLMIKMIIMMKKIKILKGRLYLKKIFKL